VTVDAALIRAWVAEMAAAVAAERDHLTSLDAAIGDADHGVNLDRGFAAVTSRLAEPAGAALGSPGAVCALVGRTLISTVGGASGPLYGTVFREIGKSLGDAAGPDDVAFVAALQAALAGVQRLGAAQPGDKTMVDAYAPALAALDEAVGAGQVTGAAHAADDGARATVALEARKGRASYLGARSVGHQDPGATSTALLFAALRRAVEHPTR
jgi:dihydroxyacetone kinase phosphoprotein-dependent L subunit